MFDLKRTFALIKGAMFDPDTTWKEYLPEAGDWKKTAFLLTVPLIVGAGVLGFVIDWIIPNRLSLIPEPGIRSLLGGMIATAISAGLVAFIVSYLAGMFKGKNDFGKSLAATSLAFVPGYLSQLLTPLPWIGWLLALVMFVYALILLYRIIPLYLEVPEASRLGHYLLSIVSIIVVSMVLGYLIGGSSMSRSNFDWKRGAGTVEYDKKDSGMFGSMERTGRIMEEAQNDNYEPPSDGRLSEEQVKRYLQAMQKTRELREDQAQDLKKLAERADKGDVAALGEVFSGIGGVVGLSTAEMEVVKTAGGNWAEHQWIRDTLRVARVQKDINASVSHNYKLFQKYESELREYGN